MTITYIGKSGVLNLHLRRLLAQHLTTSASARGYFQSKVFESDTIVWGGRYLTGDILNNAKENESTKFLYISTFIYNDFCDNYQTRKISDSMKAKRVGVCSLDIPFIAEFHDKILENIATKESSEFFTYCTRLIDIADAILEFDKQGTYSLDKMRVNIKLSKREQVLWKVFAFLYLNKNKVTPSKFKLAYLNAVKVLEKALHKIMFCHGLSAVYIKKEN